MKLEEGTFLIHTILMDTNAALMPSTRARDDLFSKQELLSRDVLGQVAGKWSIAVLCVLVQAEAPMRFSLVLNQVDGITQKVLTQTLRHLERDGFVGRKIFAQVPPRVEYVLTKLGHDLYARVNPLIEWAREHTVDFEASRLRFNDAARTV